MNDRRLVCHVVKGFGQQNDESQMQDSVVHRQLPTHPKIVELTFFSSMYKKLASAVACQFLGDFIFHSMG